MKPAFTILGIFIADTRGFEVNTGLHFVEKETFSTRLLEIDRYAFGVIFTTPFALLHGGYLMILEDKVPLTSINGNSPLTR